VERQGRRPHVGLLIDRAHEGRGGAERALFQLARWLVGRGWQVSGFAREVTSVRDAGTWQRLPGPPLFPLAWTRGARERRLGRELLAAARAAGCDVTLGVRHLAEVDVLWPHGGAHAVSLAALRSAQAGREVECGAPPAWSRHRAFLELERAALEGGARRVVCVSELVRREFEQLYPGARERLVVCANGVDLAAFQPRERARAGAELRRSLELDPSLPVLACAARNPLLKGVPVLFEALAQLGARPWQLVLAGPADVETWQARARAAGLPAARVRVVAEVEPVALAAAADLALLPTWRDTCGLSVLEALACGTPVVTTERAGAAELVRDPECGSVLARPGDAELLARTLERELERVARGVDRERVRSAVAARGLEPWLAGLERVLLEVADERGAGRGV